MTVAIRLRLVLMYETLLEIISGVKTDTTDKETEREMKEKEGIRIKGRKKDRDRKECI